VNGKKEKKKKKTKTTMTCSNIEDGRERERESKACEANSTKIPKRNLSPNLQKWRQQVSAKLERKAIKADFAFCFSIFLLLLSFLCCSRGEKEILLLFLTAKQKVRCFYVVRLSRLRSFQRERRATKNMQWEFKRILLR
jgi:hypothetical protein